MTTDRSNMLWFAATVFFATTSVLLVALRDAGARPGDLVGQGSPPQVEQVAAVGYATGEATPAERRIASKEPRVVASGSARTEMEQRTISVFERASPAVVHISSFRSVPSMWSRRACLEPDQAASGVVWDESGYIVTSSHVITGLGAAFVTLHDGSTWPARLVGFSVENDLAVLHVDVPPNLLQRISIGSSRDLVVGQSVFAIGSPLGMQQTLSGGLISALGRELSLPSELESGEPLVIGDVIQTDAAINPGSSGGALLDTSGRLIGISTAIHQASRTFSGVGFAIPVDTVNLIVPKLISQGHVLWPELGIVFVHDLGAEKLGTRGLAVLEVYPNSPAQQAGIASMSFLGRRPRRWDSVVAIEGCPVERRTDIDEVLVDKKPGDSVTLDVLRGGETHRVYLTLQGLASSR